jgi:serine protease Do
MKRLSLLLLIILFSVKVSLALDLQQQVQLAIKDGSPKTVKIINHTGTGAGFLITSTGYIVTAAHVVKDNTTVEVVLNNGDWYKAQVINSSLVKDLALIKISGTGFPFFKIADSSKVFIGEFVIAIGYPFGKYSSTFGIVSGLLEVGEDKILYTKSDVALNPGNSGGPLVNMAGEVIAINDAIESEANTTSFSIPSNTLAEILPELLKETK